MFEVFLSNSILLSFVIENMATLGNDFNCPQECGKYYEYDEVGKNLHNDCETMTQGKICLKFKKKKIKPFKGHFMVGGEAARSPMPWMVKLIS